MARQKRIFENNCGLVKQKLEGEVEPGYDTFIGIAARRVATGAWGAVFSEENH